MKCFFKSNSNVIRINLKTTKYMQNKTALFIQKHHVKYNLIEILVN